MNLRRNMLALLLTAALVVTLTPLATARAQDGPQEDTDTRTVSVNGIGQASGTPDIANLEIGVEIRNPDIGAAVSDANNTMEAVTAALVEAGIVQEDIQTTQFNVRQEQRGPAPMEAQTESPEQVFVVRNIVRVTIRDLDQISSIIQTGLDAGANNVFGLNFGLENPDELQRTARQNAIADAQMRAEALADGFGMTLGDPVAISEGGAQPRPVAERAAIGGAGGPPISQGELTVSVQIAVTYELLP